jgi:heptosyltransferase I
MTAPRGRPPERVALVRLSALGDVVHALPVAAAVRARWPEVRLTWIVERRHAAVLGGHPAIDEVVTLDTRAWRRARRPGTIASAAEEIRGFRRHLRAARFDVALDLQGNLKSGAVTWSTRAPLRIGFGASRCREPVSALLTNRHVLPPDSARHVVDQNLALLAPLGVDPPARPEFHLPTDGTAEAAIEAFFARSALASRNGVIVLNPGAARPEKRWPAARFAGLARRLVRDAGARIVLLWGPGEDSIARAIAGGARNIVVAPPTDLHGLLAVLRRASVVVAGDTGPLHLAAGLEVPCVGLFGPTSGERNGPYGAAHRVLQSPDGNIDRIEVDTVAGAVVAALHGRTAWAARR